MGEKYKKNEINEAIKNKYGTLRAFAAEIGIKEQNLGNKISQQSPKFLKQLRDSGIILPNYDQPSKDNDIDESITKPLSRADEKFENRVIRRALLEQIIRLEDEKEQLIEENKLLRNQLKSLQAN